LKPIRIIIVEDFHAETEGVLRELEGGDFNYVFEIVRNQRDFKAQLTAFKPDVILSTYSLTGTNAVKLLSVARKQDVSVPFILLAFDLSEDIAIELLGAGMEDYVLRSTLKRLPVAIRKALQRYSIQLELQLSEAKLRASEATLQEAQMMAQVGSWEWESGSENVMWSKEMYRIYESDKIDAKLNDVFAAIHPDDIENPNIPTCHEIDGVFIPELTYRMLLESKIEKHVISRARPITDNEGNVLKLIGTLQDVTRQVVVQRDLEAKTVQRDLILSTAKIGVWHWAIGSNKLIWDDQCAKLFEGFKHELEAEQFYHLIHPDDREHVRKQLIDGLKTGEYSAEYRLFKNGLTTFVLSRGRTTVGADGKATHIDGIIIDMTYKLLEMKAYGQQTTSVDCEKPDEETPNPSP